MNKALASFIFSGETLFNLKENEAVKAKIETTPEQSNPVKEIQKKLIVKPTLILVDTITEETRALLEKIMSSVNVQMADTELIKKEDFSPLDFSNTKNIVFFGNVAQSAGIQSPTEKYQVQSLQNKKILAADSLEVISQNLTNEKRSLWASLKLMYQVA